MMNEENRNNVNQLIVLLILILIGTLGRYLLVGWNVQPFPNFEIIMILTFLAVMFLRPTLAFLVPLASMILSDLLLGNSIFVGSEMNRIVLFTYSGFAMISVVNILNRKRFKTALDTVQLKNVGYAAGLGIGFVLIYDVWTNVGWWYLMYPHTAESLGLVFLAGVPFMVYHLISGVVTFTLIALPIVAYTSQKATFTFPVKLTTVHKIAVGAVTLALIALSFTGTAVQIPERNELWLDEADETSVRLTIQGDDWILQDNLVAYRDDTVFSLLERYTEQYDLSFKYTYYEQFDSYLVDSINGNANGDDNRYWQYYVDGEIPMVGADKYSISNGVSVVWKFEAVPYEV